ncbi:MAG: hypothetical protein KGM43_03150 [Planctomycetota bacterium]|nr:hypothetical protein [Planctomycetota bacterium]
MNEKVTEMREAAERVADVCSELITGQDFYLIVIYENGSISEITNLPLGVAREEKQKRRIGLLEHLIEYFKENF